jgi:hypothetical protein
LSELALTWFYFPKLRSSVMGGLARGPWDLEPVPVDWVSIAGLREGREISLNEGDDDAAEGDDQDEQPEPAEKGRFFVTGPFVVELAALAYVALGITLCVVLASVIS